MRLSSPKIVDNEGDKIKISFDRAVEMEFVSFQIHDNYFDVVVDTSLITFNSSRTFMAFVKLSDDSAESTFYT